MHIFMKLIGASLLLRGVEGDCQFPNIVDMSCDDFIGCTDCDWRGDCAGNLVIETGADGIEHVVEINTYVVMWQGPGGNEVSWDQKLTQTIDCRHVRTAGNIGMDQSPVLTSADWSGLTSVGSISAYENANPITITLGLNAPFSTGDSDRQQCKSIAYKNGGTTVSSPTAPAPCLRARQLASLPLTARGPRLPPLQAVVPPALTPPTALLAMTRAQLQRPLQLQPPLPA